MKIPFATALLGSAAALKSQAGVYDWGYHTPENARPPTLHVKYLRDAATDTCEVIEEGATQIHRGLERADVIVNRRPQFALDEQMSPFMEAKELVEAFSHSRVQLWSAVNQDCADVKMLREPKADANDEVFEIIASGPSENRIDVVFMGDGYMAHEQQKHFDDMQRLTEDMFEGVTFSSYLPLFNIWGVFRESAESGVGTHGTPRNTAFRLYRQGTELRGLYTGNAQGARDACRSAPGCDFPSLIGNDPYYGGLGGEFTISTESETSGTVVLRHEMGHNFASVGEEYDGGSAYFGANSATSLTNVRNKWGVWLTEPDNLREEVMNHMAQDYAWYDLANGPYTVNVTSLGYPRWHLRFSASGVETQDSFEVSLDGRVLPWETASSLDRSFTEFDEKNTGITLSPGTHSLVFRQLRPTQTGDMRQLCSITWVEYEDEPLFHQDDEWFMGAYPTYNLRNTKFLRPGNEKCLMRNMQSEVFCPVCLESIWHQFLNRMSLIDDVEVDVVGSSVSVQAVVVALAQFRPEPVDGEEYLIEWTHNGQTVPSLNGLFEWSMSLSDAQGSWEARLTFSTPEVRQNLDRLHFSHAFSI